MKDYLLANFYDAGEIIGGCERINLLLSGLFPSDQIETFTPNYCAMKLNQQPFGAYTNLQVISKTGIMAHYLKMAELVGSLPKLIIANDCCFPFYFPKAIKLITIAQNPYLPLADRFTELGVYDQNNYTEFGFTYPLLQVEQFRKSHLIVVPTEYMRHYVLEIYPEGEDKIRYLPHACDTELFIPMEKNKIREELKVPLDKPVILWSGAFHPVKGYELVRDLILAHPEWHFVLVFKHNVKKNKIVSPNVSVFDNIKYDCMQLMYNMADVTICTSHIESFNLTAIESMACNVPVISTKSGLFWDKKPEFEAGLVVEESVQGFENGIKYVLENLEKFSPRSFAQANYDKKSWLTEWRKLIDEVIQC